MDPKAFEAITRAMGREVTRRGSLTRLATGLMAGLTGSALAIGGLDAKNKGNSKGKSKSKANSKAKAKQGGKGKGKQRQTNKGNVSSRTAEVVCYHSYPVTADNSIPHCKNTCIAACEAATGVGGWGGPCEAQVCDDACVNDEPNRPCQDPAGDNCPRYCDPDCYTCTVTGSGRDTVKTVEFTCTCGGCTKRECSYYGDNACGTALDDGCGGTIDCGCIDGDKCTENTCSATAAGEVGTCSFPAKDCAKTNGVDQCNEGYCDPEDGQCKTRPVTDGQECNDGLYCTVNETCQAGQCVGAPRDCSEAGDQCNDGVCDESLDACVKKYKSGACNDAVNCTENDICIEQNDGSGACQGTPKVCNDGRICTNDYCREADGQCVYEPDNSKCPAKAHCRPGICDPANGDANGCSYDCFDGCTPGYWKNHPAAWIGYSTTQLVSTVFTTDCATEGKATLLQALNFGGNNTRCGGAQILLRAAVAALLNISAGLDYEGAPSGIATVTQLQTAVNAALAGTRAQMIALASSLDYWNNAGCPCNQTCVGR